MVSDLNKISKEIFDIFEVQGWTWSDGKLKNYRDVRELILYLISELKEHIEECAEEDIYGLWVSSGRIRVKKEFEGKVSITIDNLWELDRETLMLEML